MLYPHSPAWFYRSLSLHLSLPPGSHEQSAGFLSAFAMKEVSCEIPMVVDTVGVEWV